MVRTFYHRTKDVTVSVHGDEPSIADVFNRKHKTTRGITKLDANFVNTLSIETRMVEWKEASTSLEANPRHVVMTFKDL